ncbi:dihydrolipoamide acetyltransferase family protein [Puia sp.]|jgi:2-oxoglutarate dehydrogenase E2 component (dihydrolipoamide succinyltransferase)|uniref:dihydrolipoamide acetyltransferase family protein n=1 Tax=Puia sp. TaxID=2045100 RepID=UPI002F3E92FB
MSLVDLVMPKMGESIMEATILKWHKQPGDAVKQDETVLEIATDKVDSEVPSITEGVMEEILYQVNDVVPIGSVIARIRTSNGTATATSTQPTVTATPVQAIPTTHQPAAQVHRPVAAAANPGGPRFYSPLVLNIAANEGVPLSELESIPGTGNEGRVTKKDILQYIADRKSGSYVTPVRTETPARQTSESIATQPPMVIQSGNVEIIEMDRMRRLIADHMVRSVHTSPHVTSISEADVTHLVHWREKMKNEFEKRENTKLTFTPLFMEAVIRCIKKYPLINSSVDGDKIIVKKDINIGMATALPSGNLIVPVIRNADQLNLTGLARQVNTLADNARQNKLRPEDTQGGTFTLTNVGNFGSLMGTPIINQPQAAILAVGAIKKRPMVLETAEGDAIVIRHMMYLSLSYDHRIIDGSLGATFCSAVARELENFAPDREL